jgi:osmotically-inducible protein OsmY
LTLFNIRPDFGPTIMQLDLAQGEPREHEYRCWRNAAVRSIRREELKQMSTKEAVVKLVQRALEREPRVNLHRNPIRIDFAAGAVVLEGEVPDLAAKKLALEHAAAIEGVRGVVDRLRVLPAERRGDGAMRDSLAGFLLREPELQNCAMRVRTKGRLEVLREAADAASGYIEMAIDDGLITLEGRVISLSHKRVAGVLAWWTPGCRDVINSLDVQPDEEDNDAEVIDALGLVLEMDPMVQADQVRASCHDYVVTLDGYLRTEEERHQVELDAWCVFGVDRVVNRIEVRR